MEPRTESCHLGYLDLNSAARSTCVNSKTWQERPGAATRPSVHVDKVHHASTKHGLVVREGRHVEAHTLTANQLYQRKHPSARQQPNIDLSIAAPSSATSLNFRLD